MNKPIQIEKYGTTVWANEDMELIRKNECLCLHCGSLGSCDIAREGYHMCKKYNVAFMMTRCPFWKPDLLIGKTEDERIEIPEGPIKLWLDDIRDPSLFEHIGWLWAKTAEDAIRVLATGRVTDVSLDHDLTIAQTMGNDDNEKTGYTVACWMEESSVWPGRVKCHSQNPAGKARIQQVIDRHYNE